MRDGHFYIITTQVNDGITYFIFVGLALQQVEQPVFADIGFTVEDYFQSRIQETVVPDLVL